MVIIESGATKADWTYQFNGQIFSFRTAGMRPGSHHIDYIQALLELGKSKIPQEASTAIYCYASGCLNAERNELMTSLLSTVFPESTICVWSDLHAAARSLLGNNPGFCGILGTGSVTYQWDGEQVVRLSGGKGFPGGDTGSGADLGCALVQWLRANEAKLPAILIHEFTKEFGPLQYLETNAQNASSQATYYGQFAPFLLQYIDYEPFRKFTLSRFSAFFEEFRTDFHQQELIEINLCGSIAFYFDSLLKEAALHQQIAVKNVIKTPIIRLLTYHHDAQGFVN
jgi:N-acetylglucosamine kinase-like BadF-type ATPase